MIHVQEQRTNPFGTPHPRGDLAEEKAYFLAHTSIFQQLDAHDISELNRITTSLTCSPGRILYRPGEISSILFFVKTGNIQLYHLSTDGRKLITATLEDGACFGEQLLCGQHTYTSFAEATTSSFLYQINKTDIDDLLTRHPAIACALLQMIGQRLVHMEARLVSTTFESVTVRLAGLLLQLAHAQIEQKCQEIVVDGFSHEELADRLGVYRETVSAALRELREINAIKLGRKHIIIHYPELLRDVEQTGSKAGLHRRE
jgi:CRP-like cAMP-binding protein